MPHAFPPAEETQRLLGWFDGCMLLPGEDPPPPRNILPEPPPPPPPPREESPASGRAATETLLRACGLEQYTSALTDAGYAELDTLGGCSPDELRKVACEAGMADAEASKLVAAFSPRRQARPPGSAMPLPARPPLRRKRRRRTCTMGEARAGALRQRRSAQRAVPRRSGKRAAPATMIGTRGGRGYRPPRCSTSARADARDPWRRRHSSRVRRRRRRLRWRARKSKRTTMTAC